VGIAPFADWSAEGDTVRLTVPPCAVLAVTLDHA